MDISKTTINFATKRNVELVIDEDSISFYPLEDDSGEPAFVYSNTERGMFYKSNIWLSQKVKEELPYWIVDQTQLRKLINFVAPSLQN